LPAQSTARAKADFIKESAWGGMPVSGVRGEGFDSELGAARFLGTHEDAVILSEAKNLMHRSPFEILRYAQDDRSVRFGRQSVRFGR
jgi:hypothetical protein